MVAYFLVASPFNFFLNRGKISTVGRAGGRSFYSRGRTNTQGLKITEKWLMKVLHLPCKRLDVRVARATTWNGSPVSKMRRNNSVPN